MFSGIVSAGAMDDFVGGGQKVIEAVYQLFRPLLEVIVGDSATSDVFFAKIAFTILLVILVWVALGRAGDFFTDSPWVRNTVSIIVGVIAIRSVGEAGFIQTMLLPYSAFGIAVTALLPFALYFFFVLGFDASYVRKTAWIFFSVVFFGLWFLRYDDLKLSETAFNLGFIYLITAALGLLMALFDVQFRKMMTKGKIGKIHNRSKRMSAAKLRDLLDDITKRYGREGTAYSSIYSSKTGHTGWDHDSKVIRTQLEKLNT